MKHLRIPKILSSGPLGELERERRRLAREERKFERLMREEPKRIAREQIERATTMPPPDDFQDRQREFRFYAALEKGQLHNQRRSQAASVLLLVLLGTATLALTLWVLRLLDAGEIRL
jgi:hypothetical protein